MLVLFRNKKTNKLISCLLSYSTELKPRASVLIKLEIYCSNPMIKENVYKTISQTDNRLFEIQKAKELDNPYNVIQELFHMNFFNDFADELEQSKDLKIEKND